MPALEVPPHSTPIAHTSTPFTPNTYLIRHPFSIHIVSEVPKWIRVQHLRPNAFTDAVLGGGSPAMILPVDETKRALIVDDNRILLSLYRRILEAEGWQVDEASDGSEALRKLKLHPSEHYRFVLTDVEMHPADGIHLYTSILGSMPGLAKRVIFMSGGFCEARIDSFFSRTKLPLLHKPFSSQDLLDRIEALRFQ